MTALPRAQPKPATRSDLESLPDSVVGEIIEGVLYTSPRPRPWHSNAALTLGSDLHGAFQRGRGGPGGWWILVEPGIEIPDSPEVVPDLAGWRRERLADLPKRESINTVPDWVCEILSPSTRGFDQRVKRPFYARIGVRHLWFIDLEARTLSVSRLSEGHWLEIAVHGGEELIRAEPFEELELSMSEWWPSADAS